MSIGRPCSLDDAKCRELRALVSAGLTFAEAARYVGCSVRTIQRRRKRDPEFHRQLNQARCGPRLDPEKLIRQAASTNWRAAAWLRERTIRKQFARQSWATCTPEHLDALCRRLIEAALSEINDSRARCRAYDRLSALADDAFAAAYSQCRRPTPMLLLTSSQELERQHEEITSLRRSRDDSSVARNVDDEHRPACDKSPMDRDKSCCLSDVSGAVGDRPNAA